MDLDIENVEEPSGEAQIYPTSVWLDRETKQLLEDLSRTFAISRSAVMREALHRLAEGSSPDEMEIRRLVAELSRAVSGQRKEGS